jgi:hypothetical protein
MPAETTKLPDEGERPKDNHLALMTGDGQAIAIPAGATLIFVTGDKPEDYYPAILMKVEKKKMRFHCGCRKPGCTRTFTWTITAAAGNHPHGRG